MAQVITIREAVARAKAEGYPVSEYALRMWIKQGTFPVRKVGSKFLIFYPNLVAFIRCESGADNPPPEPSSDAWLFGQRGGR